MKCSNCECENPDGNIQCEVCGAELDNCKTENDAQKKKIDKNKLIIVSLVVVIIVLIAVIVAASLTKKIDNNGNTYENISDFVTTDNYIFENTTGNNFMIDESTTKPETSQSTAEATTLFEAEINRQKALDYLEKANFALNNGEREGALQMADAAISLFEEDNIDEDIKNKYDEIYEYAPFYLFEYANVLKIDWAKSDYYGNVFLYDKNCTSNTNKNFSHCLLFETRTSYSKDCVDVYYNLSRKYNSLSGTILLPNDNKNTDQNNCYISIFGDGKKLYTSDDIVSGYLEDDFDIDVTGVETLVVSYHRDTDGYTEYAIADFTAIKNLP